MVHQAPGAGHAMSPQWLMQRPADSRPFPAPSIHRSIGPSIHDSRAALAAAGPSPSSTSPRPWAPRPGSSLRTTWLAAKVSVRGAAGTSRREHPRSSGSSKHAGLAEPGNAASGPRVGVFSFFLAGCRSGFGPGETRRLDDMAWFRRCSVCHGAFVVHSLGAARADHGNGEKR